MMKNFKEKLNAMMSELVDEMDFEILTSEDRIKQMAEIDKQLDSLCKLIEKLQERYEELEKEEEKYQENLKRSKFRKRRILNIVSERETKKEEERHNKELKEKENNLRELSYKISNEMNQIRAKEKRTAIDDQNLEKLTQKLEEVNAMLEEMKSDINY